MWEVKQQGDFFRGGLMDGESVAGEEEGIKLICGEERRGKWGIDILIWRSLCLFLFLIPVNCFVFVDGFSWSVINWDRNCSSESLSSLQAVATIRPSWICSWIGVRPTDIMRLLLTINSIPVPRCIVWESKENTHDKESFPIYYFSFSYKHYRATTMSNWREL